MIAKVCSFTFERLAGKKIDLTLDQRRRAARQLLSLYHALGDLELLTKELIVELQDIAEARDPTVSGEWLRDVSIAVDETSQRFLEATLGLSNTIEIFDPVLALAVGALEAHKFSFLLIAAQGFERVVENGEITGINYTWPGGRANELDLDKTYQWYADRYPIDYSRPVEWPEDVLLSFVNEDDYEQERLNLKNPESVDRLAALLRGHLGALSNARERMAAFLRDRFSFEDVLAVQQPVKESDRIHVMHRMSNASRVPYTRLFAGKPPRRIQARQEKEEE